MSSSEDIKVGNIYKIAADEENGITPPEGRDVWYKHFVVMERHPMAVSMAAWCLTLL